MTSKPLPISVRIIGIPKELIDQKRWVTWRYEWIEGKNGKPGKWTKPPYIPGEGRHASSTDPTTWGTFEDAWSDYEDQTCDGIGFVLGDGWVGIDFDHCVEKDIIAPWAQEYIDLLDSYAEVSPSGTGTHSLVRGTLPKGRREGKVEVYPHGRYFTVTGHRLYDKGIEHRQEALAELCDRVFSANGSKPTEKTPPRASGVVLDDQELIAKARAAKNGQKFSDLWAGRWEQYYPKEVAAGRGPSKADLGFCMMLAFWTPDASQIDRLFRQSDMMREKWKRDDYRASTIAEALERTTEYYTPGDEISTRNPQTMTTEPPPQDAGYIGIDDEPQGDDEQAPQELREKIRWTAGELLTTDFPDPTWAIPDILPSGLSFLFGRPKVGKSWLGLQIAHAVGTGGMVLGQTVKQGKVLFLALEDSPRRLKSRLQKQQATGDIDVTFFTDWPIFGRGGLDRMIEQIEKQGYTLIIIDTLSRLLGKLDQLNLEQMTMAMGELQRTAMRQDVTILALDHSRKNTGFVSSTVDDLMGSTGKSAVADALLKLYKEQGKQGAILAITGRDLEEQEIALEWCVDICCWHSLGDAKTARQAQTRQEILGAIPELESLGELATGTNIAKHLDKSRPYIAHEIANLLNDGLLTKGGKVGKAQPYKVTHT